MTLAQPLSHATIYWQDDAEYPYLLLTSPDGYEEGAICMIVPNDPEYRVELTREQVRSLAEALLLIE